MAEKSSPVGSVTIGVMNRQRTALPTDESTNDDTLAAEFYSHKLTCDWQYLLDVVFPAYIAATRPYIGHLYDSDISVADVVSYDEATGNSLHNVDYVDARKGVYRIWQANFWDRQLCMCSFGLVPEEIAARLAGHVAQCRVLQDGGLLICSYEPLFGDDIIRLNELVFPLLRRHG